MPWVLDLDGVVWLGDEPIPGAAAAVAALRRVDDAVLFVTNNSSLPLAEVEAKLGRHGIDATGQRGQLGAGRSQPGAAGRGRAGLRWPRPRRGARAAWCHRRARGPGRRGDGGLPPGLHLGPHAHRLDGHPRRRPVRRQQRRRHLSDPRRAWCPAAGPSWPASPPRPGWSPRSPASRTRPWPTWCAPGWGPTAPWWGTAPTPTGCFARRLGYRFALVLSGVTTTADLPVQPEPDEVAASLADLVDRLPAS